VGAPELSSNRHLAFGEAELPANAPSNWTSVTDDDRAARYMPWMALGGTSVQIPVAILQLVAITKVVGQPRVLPASSLSANMLSEAKALCLGLMGPGYAESLFSPTFNPAPGHGYLDAQQTYLNDALIFSNGDAELWMHLCSTSNPVPVHLLGLPSSGALELTVAPIQNSQFQPAIVAGAIVAAASYPPGVPVGDGFGGVDPGLDPSNVWPWCVDGAGATDAQMAWLTSSSLPICPPAVLTESTYCATTLPTPTTCFGNDDANQWAVRGAINAGMSVYLYVQSIENTGPAPDYNQCQLLSGAADAGTCQP
jgi:hypothetical protein